MTSFKKIYAEKGGWSDWQSPLHGNYRSNYKLSCCDCGLVHDVQFRTKRDKKGRINVFFRMRRNSKSTGAVRAARTKMRKPSPNKCDGCAQKLLLLGRRHWGNDGLPAMECTKDRYKSEAPSGDKPQPLEYTETEAHDAFEWMRVFALGGSREAAIMLCEVARLNAARSATGATERDAARYRWLRRHEEETRSMEPFIAIRAGVGISRLTVDVADASVDALLSSSDSGSDK